MQNPAMYPTVLPILFVRKGTNNNIEIQRIGGTQSKINCFLLIFFIELTPFNC